MWKFWIDRGGTFTDIVAQDPIGAISSLKLLSENPERYADAATEGIRRFLELSPCESIPAEKIHSIKMGTTVATNALLERKGTPTALVITRGFRDALRIGYQNRPRLFDLNITLPEQLSQQVIEINERINAQGKVILPLDEHHASKALQKLYDSGIDSIAIVLMQSYRYPDHEKQLVSIANKIGFSQISVSHEVSPLMKLVSRGDTTVVDAYLSPVLRRYIDRVTAEVSGARLLFMQSSGRLVNAGQFQGKDSILSGPAGGIIGAVKTCQAAGHKKIIGFDMGGTSTDVSHYKGEYERTFNAQVAGVRMRAPMMKIHTVAAGGGSIIKFKDNRFQVGPESAGANPGPACYRRGGPLTITDCNLLLGKINPKYFPQVFGATGDQPLDVNIVDQLFEQLAENINLVTGLAMTTHQIADGFLKIAVDNMANAVKEISTQRGYDINNYTLCSFGGAGGQHACLVADALGMKTVFLHPLSGVLSAYGMGLADIGTLKQLAVEACFSEALIVKLGSEITRLEKQGCLELLQQGVPEDTVYHLRQAHIKYQGTDAAIAVELGSFSDTQRNFEQAHRQRYGFVVPEKGLIVESISVETVGRGPSATTAAFKTEDNNKEPPIPGEQTTIYTADSCALRACKTPVFERLHLPANQFLRGPALIIEPTGTTMVEPGWQAKLTPEGNLELQRYKSLERHLAIGTRVDPVMLEVFNNLFMSIAEQMGAVLENTSHSVNVKERLDFSCAIFDPCGDLIANAPHMPVHLGSMGASVKAMIAKFKHNISPADVFVSNAPYNGGTHLPDITVITPVFEPAKNSILFYVASRGHHADIGGISPGSMPPYSRSVEEEGVLFDNIKLIDNGMFLEDEIRELLNNSRFPARNPDQNIADLKAQIAANNKGVQAMWGMIDHFGQHVVTAYMQHVQDNAEESVRRVINTLENGSFAYTIDNIATINVNLTVNKEQRSMTVDFTGTSKQLASNFNAPSAICYAAVLYVFRTLVPSDIPMNQGCLKPIDIIIPAHSMLSPEYPAAVVAGNVETSQWLVNALYGALGVVAAAQGTMNNFTFGDEQYQYYETICGGTGAGPDHNGTSAVQSHMTNSRLTDPEVLEWRFPVMVDDFSIRRHSGGKGKFSGGDGVVRKIRFLAPMSAAILSSHRKTQPFGVSGGNPGAAGNNYILRKNGDRQTLSGTDQADMQAGDIFVIETPGGGGYGKC